MSKQLLTGPDLIKRAKELGVATDTGEVVEGVRMNDEPIMDDAPEHEIQRRVMEAERHIRESRLWIVALVSAAGSVVSALGAWAAVAVGK